MRGPVYSDKWITDCINAGYLLPPKSYLLTTILHQEKEISFSRTKFTIREVNKIFELVQSNPSRRNKNPTYWQEVLSQGNLPGRSVHSINAQWQRFSCYQSIEESIGHAVRIGLPYCISFP